MKSKLRFFLSYLDQDWEPLQASTTDSQGFLLVSSGMTMESISKKKSNT